MSNVATIAADALTEGGRIDERWFASTTAEVIEGAPADEGLSYCILGNGNLKLETPAMIRFGQMTDDKVFVTAKAAAEGVTIENTGTEPLVSLRYFDPDAQPAAPAVGAHKK